MPSDNRGSMVRGSETVEVALVTAKAIRPGEVQVERHSERYKVEVETNESTSRT